MSRIILLTQGLHTVVDDADHDLASGFRWFAHRCGSNYYASRRTVEANRKRGHIRLHNFLMGDPPADGLLVDHINGDGLDNQRFNLRWVTRQQNGMNRRDRRGSSLYRGVMRKDGRWIATLRLNKKAINVGRFDDEQEAARAWDAVATEVYGEYAALNFPAPTKEKKA